MNASKFFSAALVAIAAVSTSSAFAADDGGLPVVNNYVMSSTTRAAVQADLAKAGNLNQNEARNFGESVMTSTQVTRAQVRAQQMASASMTSYDFVRN
jgi:hypothetical protein